VVKMILNVDKKYSKHTKLEKPLGGAFHRNEYGFIGAPCSIIENLVEKIRSSLAHQLSIGWIDAEHHAGEPNTNFITQFTDKIDFISFETNHSIGEKQYRKWFQHLDLLFVNGNHFLADKQVVIINEKKKDSLERKLDRLSRPLLFILDTGMEEIHDFLKGRWDIPVYSIDQIEAIAQHILNDWKATLPPLHGLVLAGGKSQRMGGLDKGSIRYHGVEQREFVASMLKNYCAETFLSHQRVSK
jgi:molybdopterin-guanine dinucleotide biosynthesis protein A